MDREMSEATTCTLRATPVSRRMTPRQYPKSPMEMDSSTLSDDVDVDITDCRSATAVDSDETPLIIATDFGTTFSSVAFARYENGQRPIVHTVKNYPNDLMTMLVFSIFCH
jgi:hypothetical protein